MTDGLLSTLFSDYCVHFLYLWTDKPDFFLHAKQKSDYFHDMKN
jgi:hypothetical protein